jgi:hypothetical protein
MHGVKALWLIVVWILCVRDGGVCLDRACSLRFASLKFTQKNGPDKSELSPSVWREENKN